MDEPTNEQRADWAYLALERFAKATGQDASGDLQHDQEIVVSDLLCGLMHLCERDGIDFKRCLANGRGNFNEETDATDEADEAAER